MFTQLSVGYVRNRTADWFWFVLLPPFAIAFALFSEVWLSFVALASVTLWVTVPHHFGTWCRTFGLREDWDRYRWRIIIGPCAIIAGVLLGWNLAPLTIFLVALLWDHQHSVMQQHGVARIYDFKGKSGGPAAGKLDLWLNIVLFVNHLVTVPLWTELWVQQLYVWNIPIDASTVRLIHTLSYGVSILYVLYYIVRVVGAVRQGATINPMKYAFLLSSYGLWYFAGWQTNSLLVYGIAHKLMHGLQYLVIVYWFLDRKHRVTGVKPWMLPRINVIGFVAVALLYSAILQLLLLRPFSEYGFGLVEILAPSEPRPASAISVNRTYEMYAFTVLSSTALIHYYFDSFIWKVRDANNQQAL